MEGRKDGDPIHLHVWYSVHVLSACACGTEKVFIYSEVVFKSIA